MLPEVLCLVLAAVPIPSVKRLSWAAMWGDYLLLLFLSTNGAQSVIARIVTVGPACISPLERFCFMAPSFSVSGASFGLRCRRS